MRRIDMRVRNIPGTLDIYACIFLWITENVTDEIRTAHALTELLMDGRGIS